VNYACGRAGADRVVAEITRKGGKAVAVQGDVSKAADVKRLFVEAVRAFGRLDVLVNNAGVYRFGPFGRSRRGSTGRRTCEGGSCLRIIA
jgi:3-oxoacyl-[acyl-carrier protein] reductase